MDAGTRSCALTVPGTSVPSGAEVAVEDMEPSYKFCCTAVAAGLRWQQPPRADGGKMPQYWYNVNTHQVEQDAQSGWKELIGPYDTREEAEAALAKVHERNETWEAQEDD
jgi:hypothetical protein